MPGPLWCSAASATLLTTFCFTSVSTPKTGLTVLQESDANVFLSGVVGGDYATQAAQDILEEIPVANWLPLEIFSVEDEFSEFFTKESSRYARRMVHEHAGHLGLSGPLSLHEDAPVPKRPVRSRHRHAKIKASVSTHRLGISLIFRF
ncbi:MAG: hypothetical protein HY401_07750 [Elusimicrobia bacterium]|nr:hypothetical protein [Elusimicrobiota bacterium]